MPTLEVNLAQIAKTIHSLSEDEIETLEIMLNPELKEEIKERWQRGKKDLLEGKAISKEELFKED